MRLLLSHPLPLSPTLAVLRPPQLNLTCQELHLWDLGPGPELRSLPSLPCATYSPGPHELRSSRYVVRACLGGLQQRFVLTGSEECKVGN